MARLMTETNYLNPDVEVIIEINTRRFISGLPGRR